MESTAESFRTQNEIFIRFNTAQSVIVVHYIERTFFELSDDLLSCVIHIFVRKFVPQKINGYLFTFC